MMQTIRTARFIIAAAACALLALAAAVAFAADPEPTAKIKASISPKHVGPVHNGVGTPVKLAVKTNFGATPAGADPFVIQKAVLKLPSGAIANGKLFPSCSAKTLNRSGGNLSKCPKGSKIGKGSTTGRAITLDPQIDAHAKVTVFNGKGGKSVVFNISVIHPVNINRSFEAPLKRLHGGKYGYQLTLKVPPDLQNIAGLSYVAVLNFSTTVSATIVSHGVKRGYAEALKCPKSHKAPVHLDVFYMGGKRTSTDTSIACT